MSVFYSLYKVSTTPEEVQTIAKILNVTKPVAYELLRRQDQKDRTANLARLGALVAFTPQPYEIEAARAKKIRR